MKGSSVRFRPADFSVQDAECVSTSRLLEETTARLPDRL